MSILPVSSLFPVSPVAPLELTPKTSAATGDFKGVLETAIASVNAGQRTAEQAVQSFLDGTGGELHSTILATQRAEMQLQLFLQVRNKLLNAYQEIMKAQV